MPQLRRPLAGPGQGETSRLRSPSPSRSSHRPRSSPGGCAVSTWTVPSHPAAEVARLVQPTSKNDARQPRRATTKWRHTDEIPTPPRRHDRHIAIRPRQAATLRATAKTAGRPARRTRLARGVGPTRTDRRPRPRRRSPRPGCQEEGRRRSHPCARSGKAIPKPTAVPKLEADRAGVARNLAAQEAAFTAVISECSDHVFLARDDSPTADAADKAKAKARADIDAQVDKLATAIETAVETGAAHDWIMTGQYHRPAMTWLTDVIPDAARYGLTRQNTTPIHVRAILSGAAHAVMEDQENV